MDLKSMVHGWPEHSAWMVQNVAMIATLESGAGLDQALQGYIQETDDELSQAFARMAKEIGAGAQRRAATRDMAARIDSEIRNLFSVFSVSPWFAFLCVLSGPCGEKLRVIEQQHSTGGLPANSNPR